MSIVTQMPGLSEHRFTKELQDCIESVERLSVRFSKAPPKANPNDPNGLYVSKPKWFWTDAFWAGQLWLCYQQTGRTIFRSTATGLDPYYRAALTAPDMQHDAGVMYLLSGLMAEESGHQNGLSRLGAAFLVHRFIPSRRVIPAWTFEPGSEDEGKVIIDSLMTLELLWRLNSPNAHAVAKAHSRQVIDHLIREDGSTFHLGFFDEEGGWVRGDTYQGLDKDSCWSRGQAWAFHGLIVAYQATNDHYYLDAANKVYAYLMPRPLIPPYDYDADPGAYVDTSAAAVLADGLLIAYAATGRDDFKDRAVSTLDALRPFSVASDPSCDGLLTHGCQGRQGPLFQGQLPYGDFYYISALARVSTI